MSTCQPGLKSVRLVAEPHDFKGLFQQKFFYDSVTRIVSLLSVSHHQYLKWVLLKSFGHRDCDSFQTDRPWSFLLQIQFQNIYCGLMGNNLETTSFSPSAHWRKFFVRTVKNNSQWIKPAIWRHFPQFFLSEITGEKGECFDTFCLFFFNPSLSRLEKYPVFRFPDGPSSMIIYCVDMRRLVGSKQRSTNFQRNS